MLASIISLAFVSIGRDVKDFTLKKHVKRIHLAQTLQMATKDTLRCASYMIWTNLADLAWTDPISIQILIQKMILMQDLNILRTVSMT